MENRDGISTVAEFQSTRQQIEMQLKMPESANNFGSFHAARISKNYKLHFVFLCQTNPHWEILATVRHVHSASRNRT